MNNNFINRDILEGCDEIANQLKSETKDTPFEYSIVFKNNDIIEIIFFIGITNSESDAIVLSISKNKNIKFCNWSIIARKMTNLSSKLVDMLYELACYINKRLEDYKE